MMKDDEYDIPISSWFTIILVALTAGLCYNIAVIFAIRMMKDDEYDIPKSSWFIIILIALIAAALTAGVCYIIAVLSWRHFQTVKQEKIDKATRKREKKEKNRKKSTRNKEAAKANKTPFIEVDEDYHTINIFLYYKPTGRVPRTRWSYEAALIHLAASTKTQVHFSNVSTQEHMEHVEKILGSCGHFKYVSFTNDRSPMNQQIYNLVKKNAIEMENSNISVGFHRAFGEADKISLYIEVESSGFFIRCHSIDPKSIAYSRLLDFLKDVSNKNKIVSIRLDGAEFKDFAGLEFKDLFVKLGWQYEDYMEENVTNGVASNVRLMNDTNVYCLEYWYQVWRSLENARNEADSDSGLSDL